MGVIVDTRMEQVITIHFPTMNVQEGVLTNAMMKSRRTVDTRIAERSLQSGGMRLNIREVTALIIYHWRIQGGRRDPLPKAKISSFLAELL